MEVKVKLEIEYISIYRKGKTWRPDLAAQYSYAELNFKSLRGFLTKKKPLV